MLGTNFLAWVGGAVASNKANYSTEAAPWHSWEGTGASIVTLATDFPVGVTGSLIPPGVGLAMGAVEMATGATAHKTVTIEPGGSANGANANGMFAVPSSAIVTAPVAGQYPKLYFEARVRFGQVTAMAAFIGMSLPGQTSADNTFFNSSDVFQIANLIGFVINPVATTGLLTSATKIQPVYSAASAALHTPTVATTGGIPSSADYAGQSLTPAVPGLLTDWTKLGFLVDATDPASVCVRWYQDGILLAQETLAQISAANWPSAAQLTPCVSAQTSASANKKLDLDWLYAGQILEVY